jgi:hypothetical protein
MKYRKCLCGKIIYDNDEDCHYQCDDCGELVEIDQATKGMIYYSLCKKCYNIVACPVCHSACRIYSTDEGTNSFEPISPFMD